MVWENGDRNGFIPVFNFLINGAHYAIVQIFNGALLQIHITLVTSFVTGFDVQVNEVLLAECVERHAYFVLVVCIVKASSSLYFGSFKASVMTNTANEVDGWDYGARLHLGELFTQEFHLRTVAAAPRPNAIRRILSLLHAAKVDGVIFKYLLWAQNQVVNQISCFLRLGNCGTHHAWAERLTGNVVRRSASNALVATLDD